MKKTAGILLLLATPVFAADLSGYVKMGTSASFGIEGLDMNVNLKDWLKVMKSRSPLSGEEVPSTVKDLVDAGVNVMGMLGKTLPPEPQINKNELAKLIAKGALFDYYLEAQLNAKKINTRFGANIYGKSTRFGEPFTQFITPERGVIYADTKFEKFEMTNRFYFNGHNNDIYGLDRFRYDESAEKQKFQFDAVGKIHPFDLVVKPELEYALELGSSHQYFTIQPQFTYNILDDKKQKLVLTAGYRLSNHEKYRLNQDEFEDDIVKMAPGVDKVEYFKNWEQCAERDIKKGCLDGKEGSIRAIGSPTGSLYGQALIPYVIENVRGLVFKEVLEKLDKKINDPEIKLVDFLKNDENGNRKKVTVDVLKKLLKKENLKEALTEVMTELKESDKLKVMVHDVMSDLGVKDKEISALYVTHLMPKDMKSTMLKLLNAKEGDDLLMLLMSKMVNVINRHEPNPNKITLMDDLNYALPNQEFGWAFKIATNKQLLTDVGDVLSITKDKNIIKLQEIVTGIKEGEEAIDAGAEAVFEKCIADNAPAWASWEKTFPAIWKKWPKGVPPGIEKMCQNHKKVDTGFKKVANGLEKAPELIKTIQPLLKETMREYKPKITKVLKDFDQVLVDLGDINSGTPEEQAEKKKAYDSIMTMKKQLTQLLDLFVCVEDSHGACKPASVSQGFKIFGELSKSVLGSLINNGGIEGAYLGPIKTVVEDLSGRVIDGVGDILNTPEKVRAFDMFAGMHIIGTEYDEHKAAYQQAVLNKMGQFEAGKISHGVLVKFDYAYPKKHIQTGIGLEYSYSKYKHRFETQAYLAYTPSYMDLMAGVDMVYNRITHPVLSYHKVSLKGQVALDFKIRTKNEQWLFKPGVGYMGSFEYLGYVDGGAPIEVYERTPEGHLIKNDGTVVDISTISKYDFNEQDYKKVPSNGQSRFINGEHYIVPRMSTVFMPKDYIILEHRFMMPVKLNGQALDGFMIRNELSLTIKF
ncbi:MAG: hypothetical protein KGV48_001525 [Alcaligenaceae bacterium]|nr:hypothetical protein [Alcaligenaceae bacterium]